MKTKAWTPKRIAYMFFTWNLFGLCLYEFFSKNKRQSTDWGHMTSAQKYLSMTQDPDQEIKIIKLDGLRYVDEKTMRAEDFFTPPAAPEPQSES